MKLSQFIGKMHRQQVEYEDLARRAESWKDIALVLYSTKGDIEVNSDVFYSDYQNSAVGKFMENGGIE